MTAEYDAQNHWVHNHWVGHQTYEGIIAGAEACLDLLQQFACAYLLNDNRQVLETWDQAVMWVVQDWAPRAKAAGLTHIAQIVSVDTLGAHSAELLRAGLKPTFAIRTFTVLADAEAWLREAQQQATPNTPA